VGDEQVRQPELDLQLGEHVEDLRLDRDVEGGNGLVCDDELRGRDERACDPDPLPLPARELVRVAVVVLGVQPDHFEHLPDARPPLVARAEVLEPKRLGDDRPHGAAGVERRVGVLEDELDLPT
jgi:hypothetical protein